MDTHTTVETPESVRINYEVAGIGSRFVAQALDLLILGIGYSLIILGFTAVLSIIKEVSGNTISEEFMKSWGIAIMIIFLFLFIWGYFIFFESLWAGQTPGKRVMRLRVIRDGGYPANFSCVVLRNLVRVVDFIPVFYVTGFLVMLCNRKIKRLGDFVAGTLVIKERGALEKTSEKKEETSPQAYPIPVGALDNRDILLIRKFLSRRKEMDDAHRGGFAYRLGANVMDKMGLTELPPDCYSVESFLERCLDALGDKDARTAG